MVADLAHVIETAKELAKQHGKLMVVFSHGGHYEVVSRAVYDRMFAHQPVEYVATVTASGSIRQ